MKGKVIEGIKLVRHNMAGVNRADDVSYPYLLEVNFRLPEFMEVTLAFLHPEGEEIAVRGMTRGALDEFVARNNLLRHARVRWCRVTGPDGVVVLK